MMERDKLKGSEDVLGRKELYRCPNRKSWVGERPEQDSCELQMGRG